MTTFAPNTANPYFLLIKNKLKKVKPSDYLIIINPAADLKEIRNLGFVIHKVIIDNGPYDPDGYFWNNPTYFRIIKAKSLDEINYIKLIYPKAIYEYANVQDILDLVPVITTTNYIK